MAKQKSSAGTPATVALTKAGIRFTVHAYEHHEANTAYGDEAAAELGIDRERILKTLIADVSGRLTVAVVPVARHLDLKALARACDAKKAEMADPVAAQRSSGYVLGGISPLGQRTPLRTVVDASASCFETVFVSAGKRGLQVELTPADLVAATGAITAPIATD